jgi:hypothetical protein
MNRKFKFRIWHHNFNRFLSKDEWVIGFDGSVFFINVGVGIDLCEEEAEIQQFTGYYDKNGDPIFEGDILSYEIKIENGDLEKHTGEVYWENGQFLIDRNFALSFQEVCSIRSRVVNHVFKKTEK